MARLYAKCCYLLGHLTDPGPHTACGTSLQLSSVPSTFVGRLQRNGITCHLTLGRGNYTTPLGLPLHRFQCLMTGEEVMKVKAVTSSASASWGAWFPRPLGVLTFQPQEACVSYENHVSRVLHFTFPLVI